MTILVVGATGVTGRATVEHLVAAGHSVRALTRDPAKAESIPELAGAEIVAGDSSEPELLDDVYAGAEKLYLVPPTALGWDEMQSGLVRAAVRAGMRHIVKLSAIGVGPREPSMSLTFHWQGEQEIEASGTPFTHIRGNSFFQNTLFDAETIRDEGKFYSCVGSARFAKVDTRDIGEIVARVLTEEGHEGKTYELTGPEPLSYADMARVLSEALGREITYVDMPGDEYAAALVAAGFPEWLAKEFVDIYGRGFYGEGNGAFTTDDVATLLGRPPRRYEDFARKYADAFR
jgi:uncharacterized protein YbjT (DUF2867 family)